MKKIALLLAGLLLCSTVLLAQRPKNETFNGRVSCAMGIESSAPVTFTVDNTTGDFTFSSKGNGGRVGSFTWKGKIPSAKNQNLSASGAVWTFQLTEWSDFTVGTQRKDPSSGKMIQETSRLKSVTRTSATTAPGMGTSDGKSITLNIRIPYIISGQSEDVPVTFTVTLDLSNGYKGPISSAPSSVGGNTVPMPTGTNDPVHVNYETGISLGNTGSTPTQTVSASVGGVAFALARGYSVKAREKLSDGEAVMICPDNNPNNERLVLKVHPDALQGINGITNEEVADMLASKVDDMAGVLANTQKSGLKLDNEYKIYFDDNEDGSYYPHCYAYVNGTDKNGKRTFSYTEAALVNRGIVSGTAIASSQGGLNALTEIYWDAVSAAAEKGSANPSVSTSMRRVTAAGLSFDLEDDFQIQKQSEETYTITPKNSKADCDQLFLILNMDVLSDVDIEDIPADKLSDLMKSAARKLADVIAKNYTTKNYTIQYKMDGRVPVAYTEFTGKDEDGVSFTCHVESKLVNGNLISGCAVASNKKLSSQMQDIYSRVVTIASK